VGAAKIVVQIKVVENKGPFASPLDPPKYSGFDHPLDFKKKYGVRQKINPADYFFSIKIP
jgi:hypothetical protein